MSPTTQGLLRTASLQYRAEMWKNAWGQALHRPVLGWGPDTYYGNYARFRSAFEARGAAGESLGCSHGPDPAPPGTDVRRGRSDARVAADASPRTADDAGSAALSLGSVGCIADGILGSRVQAVYAVPADRTDRSATAVPAIPLPSPPARTRPRRVR